MEGYLINQENLTVQIRSSDFSTSSCIQLPVTPALRYLKYSSCNHGPTPSYTKVEYT